MLTRISDDEILKAIGTSPSGYVRAKLVAQAQLEADEEEAVALQQDAYNAGFEDASTGIVDAFKERQVAVQEIFEEIEEYRQGAFILIDDWSLEIFKQKWSKK